MTNQKEINGLLDKYLPNANKAGCVLIVDCHSELFSVVYQNLKLLFSPETRKARATTDQNRSLKIQGVEKECTISFYSLPSEEKVATNNLKSGEDFELELNCDLGQHFLARAKSGNNFTEVEIEMFHSENVLVLPPHIFCERFR